MGLEVNINQLSSFALPTQWDGGAAFTCSDAPYYANTPDPNDRSEKAIYYTNGILNDWGIKYTPMVGSDMEIIKTIPFNLVRNPESDWYVHCDDLQSILVVAGGSYSNAQDRLDACDTTYLGAECICNSQIDKKKWKAIFDWAEIAVEYKSSENDIDSCIVEQFQDANIEITQSMEDMLEEKEGLGLKPETLLAIVAGATLTTIGLILKFVK